MAELILYIVCGGAQIYAIVESGGKQYKVTPGRAVDVDHLDVADGSTVELDRVLLISGDDKVTTGTPVIADAKVVATAVGAKKGKKILVFHFKSKAHQSKKTGHRQLYTTLKIDKIVAPGIAEASPASKKTRRAKKEVTEGGA